MDQEAQLHLLYEHLIRSSQAEAKVIVLASAVEVGVYMPAHYLVCHEIALASVEPTIRMLFFAVARRMSGRQARFRRTNLL